MGWPRAGGNVDRVASTVVFEQDFLVFAFFRGRGLFSGGPARQGTESEIVHARVTIFQHVVEDVLARPDSLVRDGESGELHC